MYFIYGSSGHYEVKWHERQSSRPTIRVQDARWFGEHVCKSVSSMARSMQYVLFLYAWFTSVHAVNILLNGKLVFYHYLQAPSYSLKPCWETEKPESGAAFHLCSCRALAIHHLPLKVKARKEQFFWNSNNFPKTTEDTHPFELNEHWSIKLHSVLIQLLDGHSDALRKRLEITT